MNLKIDKNVDCSKIARYKGYKDDKDRVFSIAIFLRSLDQNAITDLDSIKKIAIGDHSCLDFILQKNEFFKLDQLEVERC